MNDKESFTIRSSIKPQLMKSTLLKGFFIALLGILLLFFGGIFLPEHLLQIWGPPLFLAGVGLVIFGLLPFKKLTRLELKPMVLTAENGELVLLNNKKPVLMIPESSILNIEFVEDNKGYGIGIWFRQPVEKKIIIHDPKYKVKGAFNADLFLPYFSRRSVNELKEWLKSGEED